MPKNALYFLLFALCLSLPCSSQCKAKELAKKVKNNLKPYKYDGYAQNEFTFKDKPQVIEVEFTAYAGQHNKLVFCSSGFSEEVQLNIYDKNKRNTNRQKVFDSKSGIDNLFWSFEPKKSGTYYIEYTIPAAKDNPNKKTGCIVLLIGFK